MNANIQESSAECQAADRAAVGRRQGRPGKADVRRGEAFAWNWPTRCGPSAPAASGWCTGWPEQTGLVEAIDRRLHLLKIHRPYHESDHVLNLAYNAMCDGIRLEDIELRRNDEVFLDALGTERIPDPTTAGDFCRRFAEPDIRALMQAIDDARLNVWARQPKEFFDRATIDMDGTLVITTGECKQGMDISYKGTWGYHPLVVSLAETGEVLRLVNRSRQSSQPRRGGRGSRRGDRLVPKGGLPPDRAPRRHGLQPVGEARCLGRRRRDLLLRLQGHAESGGNRRQPAENGLAEGAAAAALRSARPKPRQKPVNVKQRIVRRREFEVLRLKNEDYAEFEYQPVECRAAVSHGRPPQGHLPREGPAAAVRRDPLLLLHHQRLGDRRGRRGLRGQRPLRPGEPDRPVGRRGAGAVGPGRQPAQQLGLHGDDGPGVEPQGVVGTVVAGAAAVGAKSIRPRNIACLRMEFRTFLNAFIKIPCQIVRSGRKLIYRVLSYNPHLPVFFRLSTALRC